MLSLCNREIIKEQGGSTDFVMQRLPVCNLFRIFARQRQKEHITMTVVITIGIVLAAFILLSIKLILKKNGRFSSIHISDSKAMRERGIGCATSQDRAAQRGKRTKIDVREL